MKGKTLTKLARDNNMSPSTIRRAIRGWIDCPTAELVIASYLNKNPHEIWPNSYDENGRRIVGRDAKQHTKSDMSGHCLKRRAA